MKERIAILTNFQDFNFGYSLTGIVLDQYRMLKEHGHPVSIFASTHFNESTIPSGVEDIVNKVPFGHLIDYKSQTQLSDEHKGLVQEVSIMLQQELKEFDIVFTHDFIFTGWNMPYGLGTIQAARKLPDVRFFHWIHSIPTKHSDWWNFKKWGKNHRLVYPNKIDCIQVAENFNTELSSVRTIHHIKDLRSFWEFHKETCDFIKKYPAVMQADIVKIYPASVDRLSAKRVKDVITIFSEMKNLGRSVCLVIAAQWATGKQQKENIDNYKKITEALGLKPDVEVIFTSDFKSPKYDAGIPQRMLRELLLCSNCFIFPTREETFGLVLPEACLCGVLPMMNKSLSLLSEISGGHGLFFHFGAYNHNIVHKDVSVYYKDLAKIQIGRMARNESIMSKTYFRQKYNWDYLYKHQYLPAFSESKTWK